MKTKIFTIRDQKLNAFNNPFTAPTADAVVRQLASDIREKNGDLGKYPEDFDLYELGEFDPESGTIATFQAPKHLTSMLALKPLDGVQKAGNPISNG